MRIRRGQREGEPDHTPSHATSEGRGRARWVRTLLLAALVAVGLLYLGDTLGLERSAIVRNLVATLVLLLAIVVVGSVLGALLGFVRSRLSRRSRPPR
jgi:hypothetical protein